MNISAQKQNRFAEIDALKAIAICGVVFGHMSFVGRFPVSAIELVNSLQLSMTSWAPLAFFWTSGFLIQQSVQRRDRSWKSHLLERSRRLLLPFFLFSILYSISLFALSKTSFLDAAQLPWNNTGTGIYYLVQLIPGSGHYFFLHLFLISLVIDPFLIRKHLFPITLIVSAVAIALLGLRLGLPEIPHGPWPDLLGVHSLAYVLGAFAGLIGKIRSLYYWVPLIGLIPLAVAGWKLEVPTFYWMAVPPLLFALFRALPKLTVLLERSRLGQHSAAIFVWHSPLILIAVSMLMVKMTSSPWLLVLGTAFMTIGCCVAINWAICRFKFLRWFAV